MWRTPFGLLLSSLLLISVPVGILSEIIIKNGELVLLDSNGISSRNLKFSEKTKKLGNDPQLEFNEDNTLKVSFEIFSKSSSNEKTFVPNQVNILATAQDTKLHWSTVVKVRGNGKAKWELDLARAPTDFLSITKTGDVLLELILADSSKDHKPLRIPLSNSKISKALILDYPYWDTKDGKPPASLELERFDVQPELKWTFQPPRKKENPVTSLAFTAIAFSPWLILLSTWSKLASCSAPSFKLLSTPTTITLLFITTLISEEVLILTYWAKLRLFQYLPLAFIFSLPLIITGRSALSELKTRRKRFPIAASHIAVSKILANDDKGKQKAE